MSFCVFRCSATTALSTPLLQTPTTLCVNTNANSVSQTGFCDPLNLGGNSDPTECAIAWPVVSSIGQVLSCSTSSVLTTLTQASVTSGPLSTSPTSSTSTVGSTLSTSTSPPTASKTNTSPPTTSSIVPAPPNNGISSGAAAGIGIGAAIAGAALASLILLFLFARYKRRNQKPVDYSHHLPGYNTNPELGKQEKPAFAVTATGAAVVENFLPQPAEDDAIKGELSRLRDKIKHHVQSFYHNAPVHAQYLDQNKVRDAATAVGISAANLQELILEPSSRTAALRLYIAWVVLSRSDGRGKSSPSLLPNEVASFAAFLAGSHNSNQREVTLASRWKAISGALLENRYGQQQPTEDPVLEHSIRQAISSADSVLATFTNSSPDGGDKRLRNLESIVRKASQLAFLLFSQPSSWVFQWNVGPHPGQLVVFPGVLETVGGEGVMQQPPRLFVEAEVIVVD